MPVRVDMQHAYFADPSRGRPVFAGHLYVGQPNQDPETDPANVYRVEQDGTFTPLNQPIRTSAGGIPIDAFGNHTVLATDGDHSLRLYRDSGGSPGTVAYEIPSVVALSRLASGSITNETVELNDGQTLVNWATIDAFSSDFYLCGPAVDEGRLCLDDYTIIDNDRIQLTESYPAGSKIEGKRWDATGLDLPPSAILVEKKLLVPGEQLVTFNVVNASLAEMVIVGPNADNGLITEPEDYDKISDTQISLHNTYPVETMVVATEFERVTVTGNDPHPVTSVFGRIGDVLAAYGDYEASQVRFDPTGFNTTATDVQAAIEFSLEGAHDFGGY